MDTRTLGDRLRKLLRSCAGVVAVPPNSSWGTTFNVDEGYDGLAGGFSSSSTSLAVKACIAADEGPWNARRDRRTLYICSASSLIIHWVRKSELMYILS